jgi:hypothetical protein
MGIADRYPHFSTEKCEVRIRVLDSTRIHPQQAFFLNSTRRVNHCNTNLRAGKSTTILTLLGQSSLRAVKFEHVSQVLAILTTASSNLRVHHHAFQTRSVHL